ncbi:CO/xanthine dehydrogenase Mo-binding subunit [Aequitasia blattaphilus]|uniref:Xanthine dehydrogenase family protein molybdopterin-binding subunit n=1 Tax=Aequitasia blattaphilus TaxID=2949332 RepID=A0ABT1E7P3_9FIRM|nr:xanthine dehydrogenase family protein molybdopterin-binding subunit [Aequitasia blattaphilus]MCP1101848.1 xanthine dehydrogenase family protein molybdopterin-binding subunit [Aequitasia blattaphilus]MCR8614488.1 xanthine dehydrogenase family protein molybdopterin-binding subunit [Aequitasia blattaphilus]
MNHNYSVMGKSVTRKDALDKVMGTARFAADMKVPGMLWGGVFRSSIVAGVVKSFDPSGALAIPGVECVLTHQDIPGKNRIGIILKDEPILVEDKIRRYGDAIALVAAESRELLQEALEAIRVEYEEHEPVLTIEQAAKKDAPKIHGDRNQYQIKHLEHGNVDEAFKNCDVIVENDYETPMLSHMFIEPEAGLAHYENGIMTVHSSTQNPHYDRGEIAAMLNLPNNRVVSVQMTTGGGFGGKLDISVQCHGALLAYYTGRPVKIVRSREESTLLSSKRHPMKLHYKTGATKDGKIKAVQVNITSDSGAYASYGPAVITRAAVHAAGPYEVPNVRVDASFYYTNNPMAGAFRGFGVPQVAVAHEGQMNAIAKKLGMDAIELRLLNAHRPGTTTPTGQKLDNNVGFIPCLEAVREKAKEVLPSCIPSGPSKRRGRGYGCMYYGIGNTGLPNPAGAFLEVLPDASVNLMVGCADIGQGSTSVMAQIAAEELGLTYEDVHVTFANTQVTPEGGASSASRQTFISGNATLLAARMAKETLASVAADYLKTSADQLVFQDREIRVKAHSEVRMDYGELMGEMKRLGKLALGCGSYNPVTTGLDPKDMTGSPFEVYSYAAALVDLEVDIETGLVDVLNVISAHDVGTAVNVHAVEGQIEGGVVMGTGFALLEKTEVKDGKITNPLFSKYLLATMMDVPNIYPIVVESAGEAGPFGAKGVGEPALIPAIPATADGVENALDIHFGKLPIQPIDIMREYYKKCP